MKPDQDPEEEKYQTPLLAKDSKENVLILYI